MTLPAFSDAAYFYLGSVFLVAALVEYISGVALHSSLFSSFTGNHTFVKKKTDYNKFKTAIIYHISVGIFFIGLQIIFGN
jgi:hypothetical protein